MTALIVADVWLLGMLLTLIGVQQHTMTWGDALALIFWPATWVAGAVYRLTRASRR